MATYNGIKYIDRQIQSVISQLTENDELLISDDGSSDGTYEYLCELENKHNNVRLFKGPCRGANENFFYVINKAEKDIIFICDQDDVWMPTKVDEVCKAFQKDNIEVVLHTDKIKYTATDEIVDCNKLRHGLLKNLIRSSYSGHRMAFKKDFRRRIMNNTEKCPAYDQYLGLLSEKYKCSFFLNKDLDIHMMHGNNVSKPLSIKNKIILRVKLLYCILFG